MTSSRIRAAVAGAVLATVLTVTGGATAQAQPQAVPPVDHNCLSPSGTNLNTLLDIRERVIGPPACREAFAGERWVRSFPSWGTAPDAESAVYPAGYTPSRVNPMDDFISKFRGVRIVQDIGTRQERSYTFGPEALRLVAVEDGIPFAFFASPALRPLSVGPHTTSVFMRLSEQHCDGLGTNSEENCLPGGEFPYHANVPITFFPRNAVPPRS
ncbi:hypothetical protein ACIHCQ_12405 [Streptomyces sp. NPDC052236]|uniref:hypothetical protein n=1 Tax=Streptomyces sp. NPDC052236 TaxID=3365686 RepID=UPI0037D43639